MEHAATRGQPGALTAVHSMVVSHAPHAVLLVGPASSGKTTLAMDLAAGLLCTDPDPSARPCRACRGCRLVASGNHPDLHRLVPEGAGGQIRIGKATDPEPGTVRHLIGELALLSAEGGRRVAVVEQAHRLNDDAQNALLKMLEEPPAGVTIVLCADDDECLLPTVRSRCVRVRLGSVAGREIERWLGELGLADAPHAARLARLARGRPGLALAYARAPEAERLRGEIARGLLDLLGADRHTRLTSIRTLMNSAGALDRALDAARGAAGGTAAAGAAPRQRKGRGAAMAASPAAPEPAGEADAADGAAAAPDEAAAGSRGTAADRRSAAATLIELWAGVARDLAVVLRGGSRSLDDPELLEELMTASVGLEPGELTAFLARLTESGAQLDENANPELTLDVLSLAWPRPDRPATSGAAAPPATPSGAGSTRSGR